MSSLIEQVVEDLKKLHVLSDKNNMSDEDLLAFFDLDIHAISEVEGGWEPVITGTENFLGLQRGWTTHCRVNGPAVYKCDDLIFVRGTIPDGDQIFLVYEPAGTGLHE